MFQFLHRRLTIPALTVPASLVAAAAIVFANPAAEPPPSDHVEDMSALSQGLDAHLRMHAGRIEYKQDLVRQLAGGELTLADVTAEFLAMNKDVPAVTFMIRESYAGATDEEKTAANVIDYVRNAPVSADKAAAVRARLLREYEALYGRPPASH